MEHSASNSATPFTINEASFELIYKQYWEKIYGICYHQTRDETLSQEIVQDIFESIWLRRDTLVIHESVERYLIRAAKLSILKSFRDKSIREKNLLLSLEGYSGEENDTENQVHFAELQHEIQKVVTNLPHQCQAVFRMSREKGISNEQISYTLSISEKTVKNHLNRALGFIRKHLSESN